MRNKPPKCQAIQHLFEELSPSCLNTRHRVPNHAITKSGQVSNYATKKPAPEYPTAGAGVGVLFLVSFVVQSLAVLYTTHNPEDDVSSGGYVVLQF